MQDFLFLVPIFHFCNFETLKIAQKDFEIKV